MSRSDECVLHILGDKSVQWLGNSLLIFLSSAGRIRRPIQNFSRVFLDKDAQSLGAAWDTDFRNFAEVSDGLCANIILLFLDTPEAQRAILLECLKCYQSSWEA